MTSRVIDITGIIVGPLVYVPPDGLARFRIVNHRDITPCDILGCIKVGLWRVDTFMIHKVYIQQCHTIVAMTAHVLQRTIEVEQAHTTILFTCRHIKDMFAQLINGQGPVEHGEVIKQTIAAIAICSSKRNRICSHQDVANDGLGGH